MKTHRFLTAFGAALLSGALAHAAPADPKAGGGGVSQVDTFRGSLTHAIPIQAPSYHGIEPKLALTYDSAGGSGWLGAGWGLQGISVIERTSPNGGTPLYDNAVDGFRLEGVPLVPCKADSKSPSCMAGGTHSTKIESWKRIRYDAAQDTWTVTERNGTRRKFAPVYWAGPLQNPTYSWGLVETRDTHDNVVDYTWGSNLGGTCCWAYPRTISYNQTTVTLDWTVRSDVETHGIGFGLTSMFGRLAAVEVKTAGLPVRAYVIGYGSATAARAGAAGRSLLTSVQEYGSDYALGADYTAVAGTSLPAQVFHYADTPSSDYAVWSQPNAALGAEHTNPGAFQIGDYDGDGHADLFHVPPGQNRIFVHRGKDDGSLQPAQDFPVRADAGDTSNTGQFLAVDVNGDGKSDIVHLNGWSGTSYVNNGAGFDYYPGPYQSAWSNGPSAATTLLTLPMDIDGDGTTNLVNLDSFGGAVDPSWESVNRLASFTFKPSHNPAWSATAITLPASYPLVSNGVRVGMFTSGDVNGDAYTDLIYVASGSVTVLLNKGPGPTPGFVARPAQSGSISASVQATVLTGDFNGDGRTDLLHVPLQFAPVPLTLWLSNGNGGFTVMAPTTLTPTYGTLGADKLFTADVNGDGKTDVVHVLKGVIYTWISNGNGSFSLNEKTGLDNLDNLDATATGDVNGDGKSDIVFLSLRNLVTLSATGSAGNLMTSFSNGLGGTFDFTYSPSSAYPESGLAQTFTSTNPGAAMGPGAVAVPNPGIIQTLAAVHAHDVFGNDSITSYAYSGALYDAVDRTFLGFRWARQTLPGSAAEGSIPFVDTYYHQGYGFVASPEWELHYEGTTGRLLAADYHHWASGTTDGSGNTALAPYTQQELDTWHWDYDPAGSGQYRATADQRAYDAWGNVQDQLDWGEVSAPGAAPGAPPAMAISPSGDETRSYTAYALNTAAFITSLPLGTETFPGVTFVGPRLGLVSYSYDNLPSGQVAVGDLTAVGRWLDTDDTLLVSSRSYDAYGNLIQTVEPIDAATSAVTQIAYDTTFHERPVATTNALGQVTTTSYDTVCAAPVVEKDANNHGVTTTYDALCRPVTRVEGDGGATTILTYPVIDEYGTAAQRQTITLTAPDATVLAAQADYLDGFGRVRAHLEDATTLGAGGRREDTVFTSRGQIAARSLRYFDLPGATPARELYLYDALDRVVKVTHADQSVRTTSYPVWGTVTFDESGHRSAAYRDAGGHEVRHEENLGGAIVVTTQSFDLRGNLVSVTDTTGQNVSHYDTDSLGRLYHESDPDLGSTTHTHNLAGWEISRVDPNGNVTTTGYDKLGRILSQGDHTFAYDEAGHGAAIGRSTSLADAAGDTVDYVYDAEGRVVQEQHLIAGSLYTIQRSFDAAGRVLGVRYPDGSTVGCDPQGGCSGARITYDRGGRSLSIPGVLSGATYSAAGQPQTLDLANGAITTLSYDTKRAWLTGVRTTGVATPVIQDLGIARDSRGLVQGTSSTDGVYPAWGSSYALDELGRLTGANNPFLSQTITYDATGNITSLAATTYDGVGNVTGGGTTAYTYPAAGAPRPHAVTSTTTGAISTAYSYDANGNQTSGGARTIAWDAWNRPAAVSMNGLVASFTYGPLGTRVRKVAGSSATTYIGDDFQVTTSGPTTTYTTIISLGDRPIAQRTRVVKPLAASGADSLGGGGGDVDTTTVTWLHTDHLATVVAQSDAAGKVVSRAAYTPYGSLLKDSIGSPIGYTGERRDAETGLVYLHHRYYDPALGRFISADPVVGLNRYQYASDNPTSFNDRTGLYASEGDGDRIPRTIQELMASVHSNKAVYNKLRKFYDDFYAGKDSQASHFKTHAGLVAFLFRRGSDIIDYDWTDDKARPTTGEVGGSTWVKGKSPYRTCSNLSCTGPNDEKNCGVKNSQGCSVHTAQDQWAVDFEAKKGTDVHATMSGRVIAVQKSSDGYGWAVTIDHGGGLITVYGHLSDVSEGIEKGSYVDPTQVIGKVGSTGNSTGPHLHYVMREGAPSKGATIYSGQSVCLNWSGACP